MNDFPTIFADLARELRELDAKSADAVVVRFPQRGTGPTTTSERGNTVIVRYARAARSV